MVEGTSKAMDAVGCDEAEPNRRLRSSLDMKQVITALRIALPHRSAAVVPKELLDFKLKILKMFLRPVETRFDVSKGVRHDYAYLDRRGLICWKSFSNRLNVGASSFGVKVTWFSRKYLAGT